ncbi:MULTISPECIES: tyrosine-type recombinase/integrase [Bacillus cereus group]|uniref:Tyrosine-type recombinase/integrase n=1 Tax=Bacillus cereus TaxID=1396 RepID=A0A9W7QK97_BACCE|nr:tyrosine-type recombinase/integrase [Bacillus cereus]KAB2400111.1 tyrosine-type recombinase/integrase [Bacillus cereus]KAB2410462.1 tyrosine-type recombinase/integrase [Bacillus cereus]KAB2427744.1 tyrosine-type recombinase/integrase [Bacillus cereus]
MRVQEVLLDGNKKRYMLLDNSGMPIVPVMKYLKYLDVTGKSSNTLKTYCYALKQYFDYLDEVKKDYKEITILDLAEFIGWLRSPYSSSKVTPLQQTKAKKTEKTVNLTITVVTNFYDYLYRNQEIQNDMIEKLMKQVFTGGRTRYKDFLYHINKDKPSNKNILKLKEPRKKVQVLSKEEVERIYKATINIRDRLLIKLLFETGLRIGEALSLFIEDFIFDYKNGHRIQLKNRGELPNGAKLKTGERQIHISQELIDLFDDYLYEFIDELEMDTNFVFVKLHGKNIGQAMNYQDVSALFKRLRDKTEINVHPHLFRHTHASMFYRQTKDIKQVQERLGHSQIQTTMNMYLHPSDEEIRENWEKAQHAFQFGKSEQ